MSPFVPVPRRPPDDGDAGLTAREREVLLAVTTGATNERVARQLGVSPRTVAKHLEHTYRKLGVRGRVEAVLHPVTAAVRDRSGVPRPREATD